MEFRHCRILAIFNVSMAIMNVLIQFIPLSTPMTDSASHIATPGSTDCNTELSLPKWVTGTPQDFATEMRIGSAGLTDKTNGGHLFQFLYQPNLSRLVKQTLADPDKPVKRIRMMEFGLGCAPGGGMIGNTPGGSALGWRHLFDQVTDIVFELHIFEYDKECALKWQKAHPYTVDGLHTGDASSEEDLLRAYNDAGGMPFDIMIDDASHINWHQIKTLDFMLPKIAMGGFYVVEDIPSACRDYTPNMGTHYGEHTGGAQDCMTTLDGKQTILSRLLDYQKQLVSKPKGAGSFPNDVTRIEIHMGVALLSKEIMKA